MYMDFDDAIIALLMVVGWAALNIGSIWFILFLIDKWDQKGDKS